MFLIQNIKKARDVRLVHRNKLLKVDQLPLDVFEEESKPKQTRKSLKKDANQGVQQDREHLENDDSEEEEFALVVERKNVVENLADLEPDSEEIHAEAIAESSDGFEEEAETLDEVDLIAEVDPVGEEVIETDRDSEELSEAESTDAESPPVRRSARTAIPRKMFTYNELGADPVREAVT